MRDPERIGPLLRTLREFWEKRPDLRLGQIVSSAAKLGGWSHDDVYYVEDDVVSRGLATLARSEPMEAAVRAYESLSDAQKMNFLRSYCYGCGGNTPCSCLRDE